MPSCQTPSTTFKDDKNFNNILDCVHCGLCLDSCPTYRELGLEQDSPRGRLYLMRGLWNGELTLNEEVIKPISQCLDCRACETACPSGVSYGELLEKTKAYIHQESKKSFKEKFLRFFLLERIFPSTSLLVLLSKVFRLYQKLGIPKLVTHSFLNKLLPQDMVENHKMMPTFSGQSFKRKHQGVHALKQNNPENLRVEIFTGCILDVANAEIHEATLEVLKASGCEVHISTEQSCCGALHVHSGDRKTAKVLAKRNLQNYKDKKLDGLILNAAGCGAQLKEYHHLFDKSEHEALGVLNFESTVVDIMEFLAIHREKLLPLNYLEKTETVFYDAPCHLLHAQGVDKSPQSVIETIPGVQLRPIPEADWCCGSAGVYNLMQPELSGKILDRKIDAIEQALKTYPETKILLTGNPGCLFQIAYGVKKRGLPIQVMHPIVYLFQSIQSH